MSERLPSVSGKQLVKVARFGKPQMRADEVVLNGLTALVDAVQARPT